MMEAKLHSRLLRPFEECKGVHLEKVFDIPNAKHLPTSKKSINLRLEESSVMGLPKFHLTVQEVSWLEAGRWILPNLPKDVERNIYSFLKESFDLKFEMNLAMCPFRAPKVTVTFCSNPRKDIYTLVETFNCEVRNNWSPSLGLEKTLLVLLSRILELVEYV